MKKEIWKSIPGYEGYYECSDQGNVRSLDRTVITERGSRTYKGKVMKPSLSRSGYLQTGLNRDCKLKVYGVHVLVAMTFLGHIPDGHETVVDHINNIKIDNRLENLQLISNRENSTKDQFRYNRSSKYTGVNWLKRSKKWQSRIRISGKCINLGCYDIERKASKAYQLALEFEDKFDGDQNSFRKFIKSKMN